MRVAVYGTLKRGQRNHDWYLAGSEFLGSGTTARPFQMYCVGFPVVVPGPNGRRIAVEIYEVSKSVKERLDRLEGNGRMYERKRTWCWVNGKRIQAWMYFGIDFPNHLLRKVQPTGEQYVWPD